MITLSLHVILTAREVCVLPSDSARPFKGAGFLTSSVAGSRHGLVKNEHASNSHVEKDCGHFPALENATVLHYFLLLLS